MFSIVLIRTCFFVLEVQNGNISPLGVMYRSIAQLKGSQWRLCSLRVEDFQRIFACNERQIDARDKMMSCVDV